MSEPKTEPLLPLSNERMAYVIKNAIGMMNRTEFGVPLWSIVKSLTFYGSGYSCQVCRELNLDPNQIITSKNQPIQSL